MIHQIGEVTDSQPQIDHIIKIGELRVSYWISVSKDREGSVFITTLRQGHIEADRSGFAGQDKIYYID